MMLIVVLAQCFAAAAHRYLQIYAPSNAIVARVRRESPRLRIAAGLLGISVVLVFGAIVLDQWAANGAQAG